MSMKLVEKTILSNSDIKKIKLSEKEQVIEANGQIYQPIVGYEVPIWRLNERNLNNRVYTEALGQKVLNENKVTLALADHPKDDGSVRDIVAVGKNPKIKNGVLWAEAYFVDEAFANKVNKIVELGGKIGLSSSAYGDLDEDNNVRVDGFELERYFDFVLDPSYQVFISPDNKPISQEAVDSSVVPGRMEKPLKKKDEDEDEEDEEEVVVEEKASAKTGKCPACGSKYLIATGYCVRCKTKIKKPSTKESTVTIYNKEDNYKEKSIMDDKLAKLNESAFRLNIKKLIEEAESTEGLIERRNAFESILGYLDDGLLEDVQESLTEKILAINSEIEKLAVENPASEVLEEKLAEITRLEQELTEAKKATQFSEAKFKALEQKYETAQNTVEALKEKIETVSYEKKIQEAKGNNRVPASDYSALLKEYNALLGKSNLTEEEVEGEEPETEEEINEEVAKKEEKITLTPEQRQAIREKILARHKTEKKVSSSKKTVKEDDLDFRNDKEIIAFFEERVEEDSRYESFREEILNCKTIQEAQIKAMKLDLDSVGVKKEKKYITESIRESRKLQHQDDLAIDRCKPKNWF